MNRLSNFGECSEVQHFWPIPTLFWEAVCVDIFGILWNKMLILQAHSTLTDQPVQPVGVDFVALKGLRSHHWWDQLGTKNCWWVFLKQKTCFKNQYILFDMTMRLTSGYIIWRAIGLMHYPQERDGVFKNTEPFLEISKPKCIASIFPRMPSDLERQLWKGHNRLAAASAGTFCLRFYSVCQQKLR